MLPYKKYSGGMSADLSVDPIHNLKELKKQALKLV